jgi:hypothetical protein
MQMRQPLGFEHEVCILCRNTYKAGYAWCIQDFSQHSILKFSTVLKDFADTAHKGKVSVPDNNAGTGMNIFVTKLSFHNHSCILRMLMLLHY